MNPASQPTAEWLALPADERARTFQAKPVWQRAIIVAAGPVVNFLLAILILAGFALAYGDSRTPTGGRHGRARTARRRRPGCSRATGSSRSAAARSTRSTTCVRYVQIRAGRARSRSTFVRGGQRADARRRRSATQRSATGSATTTASACSASAPATPVLVAGRRCSRRPASALRATGEIVPMMVETLGQIITGRRSVKELGGPLSIAKVSGEQLSLGLAEFVFLIALVSINLGFINLLPVPMLDGGHLLFYAIEAVRRRPVGAGGAGMGVSRRAGGDAGADAAGDVQRSGQFRPVAAVSPGLIG